MDWLAILSCGRCRPLSDVFCGTHVVGDTKARAAELRAEAAAHGAAGLAELAHETYELAGKMDVGASRTRPALMVAAAAAILAVSTPARADEPPALDAPVTDHAGVLSSGTLGVLDSKIRAYRDAGGPQIGVLMVRTTGGVQIGDFAIAAFDKWKGGTKDRQDGLLAIFAVDDRKNSIKVGYGLEPVVTDADAKRILDAERPSYRSGDFNTAITHVVDALIAKTKAGGRGDTAPAAASSPAQESTGHMVGIAMAVIGPFLLLFAAFIVLDRKKERLEKASARTKAAREALLDAARPGLRSSQTFPRSPAPPDLSRAKMPPGTGVVPAQSVYVQRDYTPPPAVVIVSAPAPDYEAMERERWRERAREEERSRRQADDDRRTEILSKRSWDDGADRGGGGSTGGDDSGSGGGGWDGGGGSTGGGGADSGW